MGSIARPFSVCSSKLRELLLGEQGRLSTHRILIKLIERLAERVNRLMQVVGYFQQS